jgi:REP element-mobilizing transposase RayT
MKYTPFESGKYYHLYNRGNNNELIFINNDNYNYFLKLVKKYLHTILEVYSYCLLPNHFHFVVKIKETKYLPIKIQIGKQKLHQPFSNLFNAYSKAFNKKFNRKGSLFQEHLKRVEITNEEYLKNLIIYVNTNPDHHGISKFYTYKYSSYRAIIGKKPTLIKKNEVLSLFSNKDNFKYILKSKALNIQLEKELTFEN